VQACKPEVTEMFSVDGGVVQITRINLKEMEIERSK